MLVLNAQISQSTPANDQKIDSGAGFFDDESAELIPFSGEVYAGLASKNRNEPLYRVEQKVQFIAAPIALQPLEEQGGADGK
jgi:hypothetical protein